MTRYDSDGDCEGAEECEKGQWFTTGWSDCSATKCKEEGGEKKRKVWLIFLEVFVCKTHIEIFGTLFFYRYFALKTV